MPSANPILVVHGGAGTVPDELRSQCQLSIRQAAEVGWKILVSGGSALDAVEASVVAMEDDPIFNAGYGSVLTEIGTLEMDAMIADGCSMGVGGVIGVSRIKNPIRASRVVMEKSPHVLFFGRGAEEYVEKFGMDLTDPQKLITERSIQRLERYKEAKKTYGDYIRPGDDPERREKYGTVGAVALDAHGNLAAATSTGGVLGKLPGRVGDTPVFGAGTYADKEIAFSATGVGEVIIKSVLGLKTKEGIRMGLSLDAASDYALDYLNTEIGGTAGLIAVTNKGEFVAKKTTKDLVFAIRTEKQFTDFCT